MMTTVNDSSSKYRTMRRGPAFPCAESACGHGASTARTIRHGSTADGPVVGKSMNPLGQLDGRPGLTHIGLIDSI